MMKFGGFEGQRLDSMAQGFKTDFWGFVLNNVGLEVAVVAVVSSRFVFCPV